MTTSVFERTRFAVLAALSVGSLLLAPSAQAGQMDKMTKVTIHAPMEIPGYVLAPGKYVFKITDPAVPDLVQIFDRDGQHLVATVFAVPAYRVIPTSKTVMQLEERSANTPLALHTWFYPGENFGLQFEYPKPGLIAD